MRLSTINENLAALFRQVSDTNDARQIFEEIFQACLRRMKNVPYDLPENDRLAILMAAGERPQGVDFSLLSAEMDEKYFDAEEGGRDGEAAEYFPLARLMSALSFAVTANEIAAYAEATYEALMALPIQKKILQSYFGFGINLDLSPLRKHFGSSRLRFTTASAESATVENYCASETIRTNGEWRPPRMRTRPTA
ncbi:hypothetical protein [Rhizobium sp. CNPSo 4039]|uniref:hypothetical protein n=1 Tax=Rhizobium sp. CNPSo 4039 TaxID=3021409 RepID=UPI00254B0D7D|nr:hypothetical protein [Rhizobium sp. CNPSo 4039]MDK4715930.1 hypothetical protein [Rhizobium sp. CNPSo 4039]